MLIGICFSKRKKVTVNSLLKELDRMLADAKEGRPIQRSVTLTEPSNHTKDYDRVITMLEMSVDETIVLDAGEFDPLRHGLLGLVPFCAVDKYGICG
jgi:hypothetical protein